MGARPVLLLHGYTQHGASFAADVAPLFGGDLVAVPLDAPFEAGSGASRLDPRPPHRTWWDATDDGAEYRGWERVLDVVAEALSAHPGSALLGFSQGAMAAAVVCAAAAAGRGPRPSRAVLAAGRRPRATALQPLFAAPIDVPSLHVVGARDPLAAFAGELEACFVSPRSLPWPGPHVVPTRGPAAEAIRAFLREP